MKEVMVHIYRKIKQISSPFFCSFVLLLSRKAEVIYLWWLLGITKITHFQFLSVFQDGGHVKFPTLGERLNVKIPT